MTAARTPGNGTARPAAIDEGTASRCSGEAVVVFARRLRTLSSCILLLAAAVSCGDDEGDAAGASGNTLRVVERDYAFDVTGELTAGAVSIEVRNDGGELHELAIERLLDGKTVQDVRAALEQADDGSEDPLAGVVHDDSRIDDIGGIQAPGTAYTITGDGIEPGDYVVMCFIPNAAGTPHVQLGMLAEFSVADGDVDDEPTADATYTITDAGLTGAADLEAGTTSIRVVNDSASSRELSLMKIAPGRSIEDVVAFFGSATEGPPDFSDGPLEFFAFVFDADQDRTITVDLTEGLWVIQTADPGAPFAGPPTDDPHALLLTVAG